MNSMMHYRVRGYGLGQGGQQITSAVGGTLLRAAPLTGPAAPFVALAGAVTELLASVGVGKGCGQTCITATTFANQAEVLLKQNLAAYMALPTPRTQSQQQAAVANFLQIWNGLVYACAGVPGTAGQNCVGDRQQGACKWRDANGQCWNWWIGYHDPIANDSVVSDALGATTTSATGGAVVISSSDMSPLLWIGAAVAAGLWMVSRA